MGNKPSAEKQKYMDQAKSPNASPKAAHSDPAKDGAAFHEVYDSEDKTNFALQMEEYLKFFLPKGPSDSPKYRQALTDAMIGCRESMKLVLANVKDEVKPDFVAPIVQIALMQGMKLTEVDLDNSGIGCAGLAAICLWFPQTTTLRRLSLRNNGLTPRDAHSFMSTLVHTVEHHQTELPPQLTIDLTQNAIWCMEQIDKNGEMESMIQSLAQRAQITVLHDPAPEKPFLVDGQQVQLSQFTGQAPVLTLNLPGLSLCSNEFDLSSKQDAEKKVSDIKKLVDMLAEAQRKPFEEQRGERRIARVFYAKPLGPRKLQLITEDYEKLVHERRMCFLSDFMDSQLTANIKYPAKALVNIGMQMGELCEYLHGQDMILMRILPAYVTLDEKSGYIRYLEVRSLRSDTSLSSPANYKNKCEDPTLAKKSTLSRGLDLYALGMFVLYLLCYRADFKMKVVYKFPNVSPEKAERLHDDATKHYTKLLEPAFSGKDELIAKIALLLTDCMKPEVAADKVLIQRPTIREFNERLQEIHELL